MRLRLDGIFDRCDDDCVFYDGDDDPAGGEIYDNFLRRGRGDFLSRNDSGTERDKHRENTTEHKKARDARSKMKGPGFARTLHIVTVPQVSGGVWRLAKDSWLGIIRPVCSSKIP